MSDSELAAEAERAGWSRFSQVNALVPHGHKLYRSSAPGYNLSLRGDYDASQSLTPGAIEFLANKGIDSIISFNKYKYKPGEEAILRSKSIDYKHFPVEDWGAPTRDQLKLANNFFVEKESTLVHCGYGQGRTGVGVTALQIYATNGQTLEPLASTWTGVLSNHVETRRQMSVLAELRNDLLQSRSKGTLPGDSSKQFAIINFATGYYLTVSNGNEVISVAPEIVERASPTRPKYLWAIEKPDMTDSFTLSNVTTSGTFALIKSSDTKVDDPVTNGSGKDANVLFTITEDSPGLYAISPTPNQDLVVSISEPEKGSKKLSMPKGITARLAPKTPKSEFSVWVLLPVIDKTKLRR